MARLPAAPRLIVDGSGAPRVVDFDDIYFATEDGLAESEAVFLSGCGLPDAWRGRRRFTIGELGFGTGLNFFAALQAWKNTSEPGAWLDFVSLEGFPLSKAQATDALQRWPGLAHLTEPLLNAWPERARGVRRIILPDFRTRLTLHVDDVLLALKGMTASVDAWFLDGFAPSKNPDMWSEAVFEEVARLSAPHATAATFTVAGHVRRGLQAVGFEVEKRPGFGRKNEVLSATRRTTAEPTNAPRSALIVGAGLAGAWAAVRLKERGLQVTVVDAADGPAQGASGNPLGLIMPRLDAADGPLSRVLIDAYLFARQAYDGRGSSQRLAVTQRAASEIEQKRFGKLDRDPPLDASDLTIGPGHATYHNAAILNPAEAVRTLLEGVDTRFGVAVSALQQTQDGWRLLDEGGKAQGEADLVILANGLGVDDLARDCGVPLQGKLGQIEIASLPARDGADAVASGDYAIRLGDLAVFGATFEAYDGGPIGTSDAARTKNLEGLKTLSPAWARELEPKTLTSRAGVRATTPDRLPVMGAAPERPGVYLLTGYGSRGLTWAPFLAEALASEIMNEPHILTKQGKALLAPERFAQRAAKKRQTTR